MGSPVAIMKLLALTLFVAVASAVPSQQWRKADPLFEHSLTTRNMFSNPLHTVFGVQAKKVLEESRQAILGKSYAPRKPYTGKRPEDCSLENMPSGDKIINGQDDSRVTIDTTVGIRPPGFNFIPLHDDVAV